MQREIHQYRELLQLLMRIELTDAAHAKILDFPVAEGTNERRLRFAVHRTNCMGGRGHEYTFHLANGQREGDVVLSSMDVTFLVDPDSARLVGDVKIDYGEGLTESGCRVTNSRSTGKCPCGHHDLFD